MYTYLRMRRLDIMFPLDLCFGPVCHFEISYTHFYENMELPNPEAIDFIIIMGEPMSVVKQNVKVVNFT